MKSRRIRLYASVVGAMLAVFALLAPAALGTPTKKGYERFAGCPSPEEFAGAGFCSRLVVNGGHFKMGNKDVPITNPMTLTGAIAGDGEHLVANSKGGLAPVRQTVPGGIIGLTGLDWLVNFLNLEGLKLYAVTELAGAPLLVNGGEEVVFPIRVHLENPVLGNGCYVGTTSSPIQLRLTLGTTSPPAPNKPISGVIPTEGKPDLPGIFLLEKGTYVDNSFSAPGASGCVLTLFGFIPISINGLVNSTSGLPAAAGTNETKQNFNLEIIDREVVYP